MRERFSILRLSRAKRSVQKGATAVEFALVALFFLTLLIGIMEFGRWLFTLNAASEATRWGARLAVVCSMNEPEIKERMRSISRGLTNAQISITYSPPACDSTTCLVNVSLSGVTFTPLIPFLGAAVPVPPYSTSLTRELMDSTGNPVCS